MAYHVAPLASQGGTRRAQVSEVQVPGLSTHRLPNRVEGSRIHATVAVERSRLVEVGQLARPSGLALNLYADPTVIEVQAEGHGDVMGSGQHHVVQLCAELLHGLCRDVHRLVLEHPRDADTQRRSETAPVKRVPNATAKLLTVTANRGQAGTGVGSGGSHLWRAGRSSRAYWRRRTPKLYRTASRCAAAITGRWTQPLRG